MKRKILFIALTALVAGGTFAQQGKDTISYPDWRYFYSPLDTTIGELYDYRDHNQIFPCAAPGYRGYLQYKVIQPLTIYGIAVTPIKIDRGPIFYRTYCNAHYLYNLPLEPDPPDVDSSLLDLYAVLIQQEDTQFVRVDSVKWHPRDPDRYFRYRTAYTHSSVSELVLPVFEFFFDTPQVVHDSFYVGFRSDYFMHPDFDPDTFYEPESYTHYPQQWVWNVNGLYHRITDWVSQNQYGRTWYMEGWRLGQWLMPPRLERWSTIWGGIFPIIVPPDTDAVVGIPVLGFHRTEDYDGWPSFVWNRTSGQLDYEFGYGPADQSPDDYRIVTTHMPVMILRDSTLDATVVYAARCRASCHHACAIHDTTVWGEWTDTVHFRLSTPDPHGGEGIVPTEVREPVFVLTPNPAKERVTVMVGEGSELPCMVVLRDEQGRELLRRRMEGRELTFPTRGLSAGVYLVTVESPRGSHTQKLVVE